MKKLTINRSFLIFVALIIVVSIWGPEVLATYQDKAVLNQIHVQEVQEAGEGYRYTLNSNERLYILSKSLNSQNLPESEMNALTKLEPTEVEYSQVTGTYAFVVKHRGPSGKEITDEQIYETCNRELATLKEMGILEDSPKKVEKSAYDAILYSAIDVLEPRNNVAVWKLNLSNSQKNANKENRLIDVYIDADNGKIYEFYVRTAQTWDEINPDEMIQKWSEYIDLDHPVPYETENPLLETTPYYKKYVFQGMGEENTIVTIGFYEGINELFVKITK